MVTVGHFLLFQSPDNPENQNFKIEKIIWRYYHFTCLCHTWQSYDVCFLRYGVWRTGFFVILDHFLPFHLPFRPSNNPKKSKFWKNEKIGWRYYHFIQVYHKWHMMYGSWDMERVRQKFLSFWTISCPFTPLATWKIKILKNWKKNPGDIIILQWFTKNHDHVLYCSWYMGHNRCNWYFSFWAIFCLFISLTARKIKILKNWKKKNAWRYHRFTMVYQKPWSYAILFLRYGGWQM